MKSFQHFQGDLGEKVYDLTLIEVTIVTILAKPLFSHCLTLLVRSIFDLVLNRRLTTYHSINRTKNPENRML